MIDKERLGKAEEVGNNDAAAAEDEREKKEKGQTTTYPYVSILVAWKKFPSQIPRVPTVWSYRRTFRYRSPGG